MKGGAGVTARSHQPFLPALDPNEPVATHRRVAFVAPLSPIDRLYSYAVPPGLSEVLQPGQRVVVPLGKGNRQAMGFCVGFSEEPWTTTRKALIRVVDKHPLLDPPLIELGLWISRYYCCPPGRTLAALIPAPVRRQSGFRRVRCVRPLKTVEEIEAAAERFGAKQRRLMEHLASIGGAIELGRLKSDLGCGDALIRTAVRRGWIQVESTREPVTGPSFDRPLQEPGFTLNPDQTRAVDTIVGAVEQGTFRVLLLFGVAGSGKTEVYIQAIRHVVSRGRQAILLVPEIALTTQLVDRLARRFADVAVIHSGLTGVQRSLVWNDIAVGRKRVVIGTRSAVFAPVRDLGLIVVDEEQDTSYKNLQAPRFNARDVAIVRAQQRSIPVVLGSATPSLETWFNAERLAHYEVVRLDRRVAGLPLPTVHIVPMESERSGRGGTHVLSAAMERQLQQTFDRREQAVLLLNRRGYARYIFCPRCGWTAVCPSCDSYLVYHKTSGVMRCHRCSRRQVLPRTCPNDSCGGTPLRSGMGTQRVEEEFRRKFPHVRVARADSDTMTRTEHYEELIRRFEGGEFDVLIGTQMIAKGLDFPFVSFVGVINADTTLMLPDFRAGERTFQLIMQVAGRAGRAGGQGTVLVQTEAPELAAIRLAVAQDYPAFAAGELAVRRKLRLPPIWRMTRVVLADPRDSCARREAERLGEAIRDAILRTGAAMRCDGPGPCPVQRERRLYRYELLLRARTGEAMQKVLDHVRGATFRSLRVKQLIVDVDPISLL
mgnify:CR=1 FL=1